MSIISEIKCARCDRKYSGVRSRCPYCGARRIGSGKYSEEGDNSKGKMIIGILVLGVLVVAAGVLLFTTPIPEDEVISSPAPTESEPLYTPDEGNVSVTGTGPSVPESPEPDEIETESPSPTPIEVQSVDITYAGLPITDFSEPVGATVPLRARVEPAVEFDEEIEWTSSDTSVFEVVKDNPEGTAATVHIIGSGTSTFATLTVSIGGVEAECIVRVRR